MYIGSTHVDTGHQIALKIKIGKYTLRLSQDDMRDVAYALRYNTEAHGEDIRGKEWYATRAAITYVVTDWRAECTDEFHYPLDDDWGMESWQRMLVLCTCNGTAPPSPEV